ncbi:MAG: IS200/IS605 family transposase [Dehalococcoidia bacterium]|nr:IS200/IS605 family transposase [Dehalococcoidia bacterium]
MPYWRLFYHIVWATKDREPSIQDVFAEALHHRIGQKATQLGATVHAVGGVEDHVHLAVSVPPSLALSEFVRQIKGSSSHFLNHELDTPINFTWQPDYGVISLDSKQLDQVVQYVQEQRQHHGQRTTIPVMERMSQEEEVGKTKAKANREPS